MHVHYRPAAHVLDRLQQVAFVAVVGPTGVGKTTAVQTATELNGAIHPVLSCMSRAPRPGERDGVDCHFKTRAEMEQRVEKREYVQVATHISGDLYASLPEDYAVHGVAVMTPVAQVVPEMRALPFRSFRTIFVVPESWEAWQQRLGNHHFTSDQVAKRMIEAKVSFEFALADKQTQFIVSRTILQTGKDLVTLAFGKPMSERLQNDQSAAPSIVRNLLDKLRAIRARLCPAVA